jgi:hypothetical protein
MKSTYLTVRLLEAEKEQIKKIATREDRTVSQVARRLLCAALLSRKEKP